MQWPSVLVPVRDCALWRRVLLSPGFPGEGGNIGDVFFTGR